MGSYSKLLSRWVYGSAVRRARRRVGLLGGGLPDWFLRRNVILAERKYDNHSYISSLQHVKWGTVSSPRTGMVNVPFISAGVGWAIGLEVLLRMKGLLTFPRLTKCRTLIVEGSQNMIGKVEETFQEVCNILGADLILVDALDLVELAEGNDSLIQIMKGKNRTGSLSFDAYGEKDVEISDSDDMDDDNVTSINPTSNSTNRKDTSKHGKHGEGRGVTVVSLSNDALSELARQLKLGDGTKGNWTSSRVAKDINKQTGQSEALLVKFWNSLLNAAVWKRLKGLPPQNAPSGHPNQRSSNNITTQWRFSQVNLTFTPDNPPCQSLTWKTGGRIILIRDIHRFAGSQMGEKLLEMLNDRVTYERSLGKRIAICGTCYPSGSERCILDTNELGTSIIKATSGQVPDAIDESNDELGPAAKRILEINIRHIQQEFRVYLNKRTMGISCDDTDNWMHCIQSEPIVRNSLEREVLSLDQVQRIVLNVMGTYSERIKLDRKVDGSFIVATQCLQIYVEEGKGQLSATGSAEESREMIERIVGKVNRHEKRLLSGVINGKSIKTTFDTIHVRKETIDAVKALTWLALRRGSQFKFGVLGREHISGLLLYGPPGVGKTLLAKALVKESGLRVLEVSGSEINDMYVGEGEKNVRAIFSLARKLSPCIVFLDEADGILSSRGSGWNGRVDRDIINQFLKEWDGIREGKVFLMVATNRPFDLDEAVLRRLPRRIMIDLPDEKGREEILRIHLRGEELGDDVSVVELAKRTNFYSGSDLKNLCVATAMIAVRETFGGLKHAQGEQRRLQWKHFEAGLREIGSSVNEDMESLRGIRKFAEVYGEGNCNKRTGIGFDCVNQECSNEAKTTVTLDVQPKETTDYAEIDHKSHLQ